MAKKSIKTIESELKEATEKRDYYNRCARTSGGMAAAHAAAEWQVKVIRLSDELTRAQLEKLVAHLKDEPQ